MKFKGPVHTRLLPEVVSKWCQVPINKPQSHLSYIGAIDVIVELYTVTDLFLVVVVCSKISLVSVVTPSCLYQVVKS